MDLESLLNRTVVLPVLTLDRLEDAAPLAHALAAAGLASIELTLRTPVALAGIAAMKEAEPTLIVGAGTILDPRDLDAAIEAGAAFGVSPGLTPELRAAITRQKFPFVPGSATASDVMQNRDAGFNLMKFFPAEAMGGLATLRGFAGPFSDIKFCPTGGITEKSAPTYLAQSNVLCVGGSWIAPSSLILAGNWAEITQRAAAGIALRHG